MVHDLRAADRQKLLRAIPKVDECLAWLTEAAPSSPRLLRKVVVRELLVEKRQAIMAGQLTSADSLDRSALLAELGFRLEQRLRPNLQAVINATGVVVHTNLGRSILPRAAIEPLIRAAVCYSNVEFDLRTGKRGSRYSLVERLLCELTGAPAAMVVNNNAAAVLLVLDTLARGLEVVVSRGQLVEIGGSFRIPDVMARSGATLVEVGATNRTHLRDYEGAINARTALLLRVHTSNFRMVGFTAEVPAEELAGLGRQHGIPVMEDLGSGCLVDLARFGFVNEPTVGAVLQAGVDVVTFSGDKLLGGPQAGLILGSKEIISRIRKNPLTRALRIDKFTLAALETVLRLYYDEEAALAAIPTLAMLTAPVDLLARRAGRLFRRLRKPLTGKCEVRVVDAESRAGGGALPEQPLATKAVALLPQDRTVNELEAALRHGPLPVIGRIENDRFLLDVRTVLDEQITQLAAIILETFAVQAPLRRGEIVAGG